MNQDLLIITISIATLVLLILATIATILLIVILRRIHYITERVQDSTDTAAEMVKNIRDWLISPSIVAAIIRVLKRRVKKSK